MKIKWEAYDGYHGGSRPQYVEVPDDEIQDCESRDDVKALIDEYVKADFEQTVSYDYADSQVDKAWELAQAASEDDDEDLEGDE